MNLALLAAGVLALAATAIHGLAGDALVRRIRRESLPATPLGGPQYTWVLLRASWHFVTLTFLLSALVLLLAGAGRMGEAELGAVRFVGVLHAAFAAFALIVALRSPRLLRHPAPLGMSAIAGLVWWGTRAL